MLLPIKLWISKSLQSARQKKDARRLHQFISSEIKQIASLPAQEGLQGGTLIVKCDDIGDFLLWQQVIPAIKANAVKPVTFVGNAGIKPLLETWFDFADHYIWINKAEWDNAEYRLSIYREVRKLKPALAFTTLFTRNFRMDDLIVYASGAGRRLAWNRKHHPYFPGLEVSDKLMTETISSDKAIELEYFRHIEFIEKIYQIKLEHHIKALFPDFGKQKRLVIFPAANTRSRWWHYQKYARLIKELAPSFDSILLLGGKNALDYARQIEETAAEPKVMNLCGQTSLTDLMAFIGESSMLICPDTSAMHFAMLCNTDTVVLSNGNNWQRFANYGPYVKYKFKVIFPPYFKPEAGKLKLHYSSAEIQTIKVDTVVAEVKKMLN